MNVAIDKHHEWVKSFARGDSVYTGIVRPGPWYSAAGTGVGVWMRIWDMGGKGGSSGSGRGSYVI